MHIELTEECLKELRHRFRYNDCARIFSTVIVGLIDAIAAEKGFEVRQPSEILQTKYGLHTEIGAKIKKMLQRAFPGWHYGGLFEPDKDWSYTFYLERGGARKILQVNVDDLTFKEL